MIKKFILYHIRWQLSTPILAPIVSLFTNHGDTLFAKDALLGAIVANVMGASIFFWVDKIIFHNKIDVTWERTTEPFACPDCGDIHTVGYRIIKYNKYNRETSQPVYRCTTCSQLKARHIFDNN